MAAKIFDEAMTRRNLYLPDRQFSQMNTLARHEKTSVAALYREAAQILITQRCSQLRAQRGKSAPVKEA